MRTAPFHKCPECGNVTLERRTKCACGFKVEEPPKERPKPLGFRGRLLRFVDSRSQVVLVLIGLGLLYYGYEKYQVSRDTTTEPLAVELAQLESGERPMNNHLRIGEHFRLYLFAFYETKLSEEDMPEPLRRVEAVYYPIVSTSHPYIKGIEELVVEKSGKNGEDDSERKDDGNRKRRGPGTMAVLVKTKRYRFASEVPSSIDRSDQIQGLVINSIRRPLAEEAEIIRKNFPDVDTNKLIVLDEGRTPSLLTSYSLFFAGGAALIVLAFTCYFMERADRKTK